jgi:hypothetical protein
MTGDGGGYIPLSDEAIKLIFDYWGDCVDADGLTKTMDYFDNNLRDKLYQAVEGTITINLSKGLHWDQFGYHFTGTLGADDTTIHFYVEIYINRSDNDRRHVGSDFMVKDTRTRWRIVTIANTYGYSGYNDRSRNAPPFPTQNSPSLARHMPPKKAESDTVGKWTHDKFFG